MVPAEMAETGFSFSCPHETPRRLFWPCSRHWLRALPFKQLAPQGQCGFDPRQGLHSPSNSDLLRVGESAGILRDSYCRQFPSAEIGLPRFDRFAEMRVQGPLAERHRFAVAQHGRALQFSGP